MGKYYTVERKRITYDNVSIKILVIKPKKNKKPVHETPGILWIHGGGFATGSKEMVFISRAISLVKKYGAVVVAPSYRLAPIHKYPRALNDCYETLKYIKNHAKELGINDSQIMVGGESAGGGLAVAISMLARDKGEVNIAYQMPLYPMLDNMDTESSKDNHSPVWNTKRNHTAWKWYLGKLNGKNVPPYASPARATNYSNLPPAYTFVGDIDPFYSETLTYIDNLKKEGIDAHVDVYKDCFHSFDLWLPYKKETKEAIKNFENHYLYATKNYFKKQN